MPKSSPIQANFSGGELGPLVEGRVDVEKQATGLEICQNYIPTLEGPLVRRPGTKRVASVKDPSKPPRFIPFRFSNSEQYLLEMGENYMRFFTDEGQVVTSGTSYLISGAVALSNTFIMGGTQAEAFARGPFFASRTSPNLKDAEIPDNILAGVARVNSSIVASGTILEIPTVYDYNMLPNIGYTQKGDTLWLMHSSVPTFTLQRFTPQDWDLKYFQTKDGPYLPLNSRRNVADSIGIGFDLEFPYTDSKGAISGYNVSVYAHSSIKIANVLQYTGSSHTEVRTAGQHGFLENQKVWIAGVPGSSEINNGTSHLLAGRVRPNINDSSVWTISVLTGSSFLIKDKFLSNAYLTGSGVTFPGIVFPAVFTPQDAGRAIGLYISGQRYSGTIRTSSSITKVASDAATSIQDPPHPIQAEVAIDQETSSVPVASTVVSIWQMGAYGRFHGYPSAGTFHQNRLMFTGAPGRPTEFAASKTNDYQFFNVNEGSSLQVLSTNALQFNLISESADQLRWVKSGTQGVYLGSNTLEFLVSPSREGEALTPTNINNDIVGFYGSANVNPVRFGDSIIYLQTSQRKIRELRYFANLNSHKSTLINQVSDHIALPQVNGLATQKESIPLIWGYKSDGKFISMSYSRDDSQVIAGWAGHELGGRSDSAGTAPKVLSIETMRDSTGKYDQLWMTVQRFINGTSTVEVEYMVEPWRTRDLTQKQRDAFYVDCGATYDSSLVVAGITLGSALVSVTSHGLSRNDLVLISDVVGLNSSLVNVDGVIVGSNLVNDKVFVVGSTTTNNFFLQDFNSSIIATNTYSPYVSGGKVRKLVSSVGGLTWLKNEEVDVLGDGGYQGKITVNSGGILVLSTPAAVVQVGYEYRSRGKTLIKDSGSATGSAVGMNRKTYEVAFRLRDVGSFSYGGIDFDHMHQANFGLGDVVQANYAIPLYSGIYRDGIEQDVGLYGQVYFEQRGPLPGMIQSITYLMDEYDT